ncbi:FMN-dependent dehydrogenase [Kalmanozyma brasiliensis GHG001]|uniref:L-lactate dehydrogenase n=1 Tax=Kalmanozyma brasiliensis (strain GHG001) TaxID=1365824 RepID=V5GFM0_KALBG|nr:FMN-dependent dehydrogenase [Kalmanozyma brasiliensis GHG001]EST04827.1 FMN-dependent dehydrogenase [Kalmanozyma brasiliensis GHG001]
MDPTNLPKRSTPHWALYQRECFERGTKDNQLPPFNTHPEELERLARERLTAGGWSYASCNAGLGTTHVRNRTAFDTYNIIPRMLVDTTHRDTTTTLFGKTLAAPICFSPVGINKIYHPEGEIAVAKVAGELGLPYTLSTAGSVAIEDAGAANRQGAESGLKEGKGAQHPDGLRWFQLYLPHQDDLAVSLLQRAWDSGFDVCMLTLDTWQLGWRHLDVSLGNYGFYKGVGNDMGLSDPVFNKILQERGIDAKKDIKAAGRTWIDQIWHGKAFSWDKMPWVIETWKRISGGKPFLLKGILSAEDAIKAREVGCDGIVVTTHAGRQVDGSISSLEALPEIVAAVGKDMEILFDSGVRGASDAFKALALGAKAVMVGRLWIYGLSIQGEEGVRHVMRSLLAEFDILMNVAGFRNVGEINETAIRKAGWVLPSRDDAKL